jgi:two-component system, cell cycle sensor histidine kinase and response regulator CckA
MPEGELEDVAPRATQNGAARTLRRPAASSEGARWRELGANAPGTIALLARDGRVSMLSGALFARDASACVGRPLAAALGGDAAHAIDAALERLRGAASRGQAEALELEVTLGEPAEGARTYRVRLMTLEGEQRSKAAFSAFVSDITEHAAQQQALREREALLSRTQKSAQLAFMAGGVAHDFNNLLTVIVGAADLLGEEAPLGSAQRAELLQIQRAGERATEITRQLLAFSRREPSVPRRVDLAARVAELEGLLLRLLGAHIRLERSHDEGLWPVWLDPLHAEQVITHLVCNARQAMPRGGVLRLALRNLEITRFESQGGLMVGPGQYVELRVSDTGPGMSAAAMAVAFEPFFSARPGEVPTDLSLALVRSLIVQSLGHIWVESEPGRGATFVVLWPRSRRSRAGA